MNVVDRQPVSDPSHKAPPRGLADVLGVTALMQMMRRRVWLMLIAGAVAAVSAFAFLMLREPTFSATALLIANPREAAPSARAYLLARVSRSARPSPLARRASRSARQ